MLLNSNRWDWMAPIRLMNSGCARTVISNHRHQTENDVLGTCAVKLLFKADTSGRVRRYSMTKNCNSKVAPTANQRKLLPGAGPTKFELVINLSTREDLDVPRRR